MCMNNIFIIWHTFRKITVQQSRILFMWTGYCILIRIKITLLRVCNTNCQLLVQHRNSLAITVYYSVTRNVLLLWALDFNSTYLELQRVIHNTHIILDVIGKGYRENPGKLYIFYIRLLFWECLRRVWIFNTRKKTENTFLSHKSF